MGILIYVKKIYNLRVILSLRFKPFRSVISLKLITYFQKWQKKKKKKDFFFLLPFHL